MCWLLYIKLQIKSVNCISICQTSYVIVRYVLLSNVLYKNVYCEQILQLGCDANHVYQLFVVQSTLSLYERTLQL